MVVSRGPFLRFDKNLCTWIRAAYLTNLITDIPEDEVSYISIQMNPVVLSKDDLHGRVNLFLRCCEILARGAIVDSYMLEVSAQDESTVEFARLGKYTIIEEEHLYMINEMWQ